MQHDLKRVLAYQTIENIGIIFIGLGLALAFKAIGMPRAAALAMTAALLHAFNHSLFKSLLFFGAGAVLSATGERDMEHLGGLIHNRCRDRPFAFLVGCVAISALPPFNGFVSEWLTLQAMLLSPAPPVLGAEDLGAGGRGAARAVGRARCRLFRQGVRHHLSWTAAHDAAAQRARDVDRFALAAMATLAALCLLAGIFPGLFIDALRPVASSSRSAADADAGRRSPGSRSRRSPKAAVPTTGCSCFLFIAVSASLAASCHPSLRLRRAASRAGVGLRLSRPKPGDAIHGESFAQPIRRVFGVVAFVVRERDRHAGAGRDAARAFRSDAQRQDLGRALCAARPMASSALQCELEPPAVPHHPPVSERRLRRAGHASRRARVMAMIVDLVFQLLQMTLVIAVAPLLTGLVRATKARLLRRRGPPLIQPYRDLVRLARKEAVVADSASWLFRFVPYLVFAATWVAAALVPTFATGLLFSWSADLIAIIALLGAARFFLALAGLDVGTSFGGLGSSREALFGALAEPAMIVIVFTLALVAGSTQLSTVAAYMVSSNVGLRVSLGMALVALIIVALAENGRIPVDNPATHLELTMVHEAMILEYSGRHLAVIELAAMLKLVLYVSLIVCVFAPWGLAIADASVVDRLLGAIRLPRQAGRRRRRARRVRDQHRQDARLPRARFRRRRADARLSRRAAAVRLEDPEMKGLSFDVAHLLAGGLVLISFMLLYQTRLYALLNVFALQAVVLSLSVAWQAYVQDANHLYVTAAHRLRLQGVIIPVALHRIIAELGIQRDVENVVGVGPTMLAGLALVALSEVVMLRIASDADVAGARGPRLCAVGRAARHADDGRAAATPSRWSSASCRSRTGSSSPRPGPRACRWWSRFRSPFPCWSRWS